MNIAFAIITGLTLLSAVAAVTLRNLVHSVLATAVSFAGLAGLYLQLNAQFVGFAQVLVYIGAVSILIVFAILLTGGSEPEGEPIVSRGWGWGLGAAAALFALMCTMVLSSNTTDRPAAAQLEVTTRQIGDQLMTRHILVLEAVGLLLTVALIGAVIIAMHERKKSPE